MVYDGYPDIFAQFCFRSSNDVCLPMLLPSMN